MSSRPLPLYSPAERIGLHRLERVVNRFYERLRDDPRLARFFVALPDPAGHERLVVQFWWTTLGGKWPDARPVNMLGGHAGLSLTDEDLSAWMGLFVESVREELDEEEATPLLTAAYRLGNKMRSVGLIGK